MTSTPNPVQIPIGGDSSGQITCNSHAFFYQQVTLQIFDQTVVFSGTGEGVPMTLPNGATVYDLGPTRQGYSISALFQFSTVGPNGPFQNSNVQPLIISTNGGVTFVFATAEDGVDSDNNDSYLTVFYQAL